MTAVEHVVLRLTPAREATDAVDLAERIEPVVPTGEELVRVGLMAGVPHDPVARRLEQAVQGDGQLDDTERTAEMAAGVGDGADDLLADLAGELLELVLVHAAKIGRAAELGERDQAGYLWDEVGFGFTGRTHGTGRL